MTDRTQPPPVRPMVAGDYAAGERVPQAAAPADHPNRDLVVGAVVGAVALWAVPKVLDFVVGAGLFGGRDDDGEEYDLEVEE